MRIELPVAGRPVLVVGAGISAASTARGLAEAQAQVLVITDDGFPDPALEDLADRAMAALTLRRFDDADVDGRWLVYPRTGDPARDAKIADVAEGRRVWAVRTPAALQMDPALAGSVSIVGGGPGDPGLITVRGAALLAEADVVVADRLGPVSLIETLAPNAQIIDASKVPHGGRSMPQSQINEHLIAQARVGRRVVRLKGGDPFVFGRGMEEIEACLAAGIPVQVVPGVTSAIAVPGLAGVPVTHRGLTQAFTVVSGHVPPGHPDSQVDWAALAASGATLVLLMAVRTLPAIAAALLEAGLAPATATTSIVDGASPQQRIIRSSLADLASIADQLAAPAVTVIGAVAGLV
jgi:uroporphyrin-III C-methyltransferase/precorrin-2 dehydrogenase/sirohydrochlorin ferrochelatase